VFILDQRSVANLNGVHPFLVNVANDMAKNAVIPFTFAISQGLRTTAQQRADVAAGKSTTMRSRHLNGMAIDFVVLVNGQPSWSWNTYYTLADQMKAAGDRLKVPLTWGGVWDKKMADYTEPAITEAAEYIKRGGRFQDGPHLELPWDDFPGGATVAPSTAAIA
jgi:peptidoglycan L-alanyl-D-glutamate endopeptidase CwlK